ncbi:hypothetical protein EV426DRAFT_138857 [Tirmania nivea]|nr:hypothetical protein EV426DRAFT_138857 [Tirmania nivea]
MAPAAAPHKSVFAVPPLVRAVFDAFPLVTYPACPAPARCPPPSSRPRLYAWSTPAEARKPGGGYSFDPECLKWQMYLRFCGVKFTTVPSNSSACPSSSGGLPFLIPPPPPPPPNAMPPSPPPPPITAPKLVQWARSRSQHGRGEDDDGDIERGDVQAFLELLDNEIHDAVLYTTHMHPPNLHNLTVPLYAPCAASTPLLRPLMAAQLRAAALARLRRPHPGTLDRDSIFADAAAALDALSMLLGADSWFFNGKAPGLLDAAVFAYLNVILTAGWAEDWPGGLGWAVRRRQNLVAFRERVHEWCQGGVVDK